MASLAGLPGISVGLAIDATGVASGISVAQRSMRQFKQQAQRTGTVLQSGFGNRLQQASFQIGDFAVQVASGQGALRAFTQQASQLAGSFGPVGAAAGAAVAVFGGLATVLFSSKEASAAAEAAHKALSEELVREGDTVADLVERYQGLTGVQRSLTELQLQKEIREQTAALEAQKSAAADLVEQVSALQAGFAAGIESFGLSFIDPGPLNEQQRILQETLDTIEQTGVVTSELAHQLDALAKTTGSAELREVADQALGVALAADEAQGKIDAATGALSGLSGEAKRASADLRKAAESLADVEFAASNLAVVEARKEVEAKERAIEEAARMRKAAADEAQREAKRAAEEQKRFNEQKVRDEFEMNARIAEDFTRRANQQRFRAAEEAEREIQRTQEQAAAERLRQQEREADLMLEPFRNAAQSMQSAISDSLFNAFDGGITSAADAADAIKDIFLRMAADLVAAQIMKPIMASMVADAQTSFSSFTTPGGTPIHSIAGGTSGLSKLFGGAAGGQGGAGAAAAGVLGGAALGFGLSSMFPRQDGGLHTGAAVGGTLGGAAGFYLGGPAGALAGGALGSFVGRQFGAGQGQDNKTHIRGSLGANIGGTSAASGLSNDLDRQLRQLLTGAQEVAVNSLLAVAAGVRVQYDKEMFEADKMRIAASRIGPAAQALGFNAAAVTQGSADDMLANLQTAIGTSRELESFRLGGLGTQLRDINEHFQELSANAVKFGISLEGLAQAHQRAADAAIRQQRAEFFAIAEQVGAATPLQAALEALSITMQNAAARAAELGVPLQNIARQHLALANALIRQQQAEFYTVAESVGAISPLQGALERLNLQMQDFAARAQQLGIPLGNLAATHTKAAQALIDQFNPAQQQVIDDTFERTQQLRLETHAFRELAGIWTPLNRELSDLHIQFENAWREAARLGERTDTLAEAHYRAAEAVRRQHQAQVDALALSITNPFEELLEPLRQLGIELNQSLMNPLEQFNAAAANFRDVAHRAFAGSTEAIAEFDDAARGFIATATQVGASPGQVAAIREVESARQFIVDQVGSAQAQAGRGVESAIAAASRREVDTLRELITETQATREEIRKLTRNLA